MCKTLWNTSEYHMDNNRKTQGKLVDNMHVLHTQKSLRKLIPIYPYLFTPVFHTKVLKKHLYKD